MYNKLHNHLYLGLIAHTGVAVQLGVALVNGWACAVRSPTSHPCHWCSQHVLLLGDLVALCLLPLTPPPPPSPTITHIIVQYFFFVWLYGHWHDCSTVHCVVLVTYCSNWVPSAKVHTYTRRYCTCVHSIGLVLCSLVCKTFSPSHFTATSSYPLFPAVVSLVVVVLLLIACVDLLVLALAVTTTKLNKLRAEKGHTGPAHNYS